MSPKPDSKSPDRALSALQRELAERTAERDAALAREAATAEVLHAISRSAFNLDAILQTVVSSAYRLCRADQAVLFRNHGGEYRWAAGHEMNPGSAESERNAVILPGSGTLIGRAALERRPVHVEDAWADPLYENQQGARAAGTRSMLGVPLMREGEPIGAIGLARNRVEPFSERETQLVATFADQAVIAIENARLITETREALEQQTATAEVLGVINSSPGDLAPVFDSMLEKATRLCEGSQGVLWTIENGSVRCAAMFSVSAEYAAYLRRGASPGPTTPFGRIMRGERIVEVLNLAEDESYLAGDPVPRAAVELGGFRSMIFVALLRDETLFGAFAIARQEVRPFTDKQIALLESFAAQAVIAMDNARLITETREALDQQTATAEVLQVINASPGDLAPVFDAMLERALRLCGAAFGNLLTYDGDCFRAEAGVYSDISSGERELRRPPFHPVPGGALDRLVQGEDFLYIAEVLSDVGYQTNAQFRDLVDAGGYHTLVYVALRKEDSLLGAIVVFFKEPRQLTDKQIALFQNFAAQAVIAMENARLLTETRKSLERQTATSDILRTIAAAPGEAESTLRVVAETTSRLFETSGVSIRIAEGDEYTLTIHVGRGAEELSAAFPKRHQVLPRTLPGTVIRENRQIHLPDLDKLDSETADWPGTQILRAAGARTLVGTPLRCEGRAIGSLNVSRDELLPFDAGELQLLQSFADQAAIAIENARLITETREALEQQTATAEVLQVINSSPGNLAPVFDAMLEKTMRLCDAKLGFLSTYDGQLFNAVAMHGVPEAYASEYFAQPYTPAPGTTHDLLVAGKQVVHITDLIAEPLDSPRRRAVIEVLGVRTILAVALRKEGELVGALHVYRQEVRPFSDKQIALLQNFAAQAVIAMENARLITETREALDQQTATAEVLRVISSSPGDLAPVFDAMLEKAMSLCEATFGGLWTYDGETFHAAKLRGVPADFAAFMARSPPSFSAQTGPGRLLAGDSFVHSTDLKSEEPYRTGDPNRRALVDLGGARTGLSVPLRRDEAFLGYLFVYRKEVRPFADKQITLLQSFAAQAVIAMENARLITETREAKDDAETALRDLKAAQASLVQAEKMASLGQLTAGIAHEIKNPLNFVNNFASLSVELLDELKEATEPAVAALDDDKRAEVDETMVMLTGNLEKIAEHGKRADNIVKSMLEHSRGVSGERREVDLNGVIEEALNLAYHGARAQDQSFNITLERDYAQSLKPIELAPQEMTRVFLNLFGNGFYAANKRARDNGEGAFRPVLTVVTREEGDAIEVRVRDNGTGIPPEIKDRLFQPFFTTKPTGEGTGLGLSISYDIVTQQHGGTITVDSEPGAFTEFTVRLPRH